MNKLVISVYGSHNAAVAMYYKGEYYVVEVERWADMKNVGLTAYLPIRNPQAVFDEITEWLLAKTEGEVVDYYIIGYAETLKPKFKYNKKIKCDHHMAHAATAFYQSPYEKMMVFTFDGGGDGEFFNVYMADRKKCIKLVKSFKDDLGFPYMVLAEIMEDIKREDLSIGNLVYSGKLMGLCAYGTVQEEWLPYFIEFYKKFNYSSESFIGGKQIMDDAMKILMEQIGAENYTHGITRYSGQFAWNVAATSQKAFEEAFYDIAGTYLDEHPELPIGLAGGCALNVILNTRLANERNGKIYVPPNTNDCGIASGSLLWHLKPQEQVDLTYSGLPVMDSTLLIKYIDDLQLSMCDNVSTKELAGYIAEGYIVGVIQGNSEHGSRALGNRSIICTPNGNMKDIINEKVKKREWYRPFAPVVKFDDVNKYFDFEYESRHMTYAAPVREEWRDILPAVTHEDGTGRLQTVRAEQNPILYDLLNEFEAISGFGVLLNTSFNINGKPILSTLVDAFDLLKKSKLDAVFYKNRLVFKNGEEHAFKSIRDSNGYNVIPLDKQKHTATVCLVHDGDITSETIMTIRKLTDSGHTVVFIGMEEHCDFVTLHASYVKCYRLTKGKIYHHDRMLPVMSEAEMFDPLKLIWVREAVESQFAMLPYLMIVDYNDSVAYSKLYNSLLYLNKLFYKNVTNVHYDNSIYDEGFGILCVDHNSLSGITTYVESAMIDKLNAGKRPDPVKDILGKHVSTYLNNKQNE